MFFTGIYILDYTSIGSREPIERKNWAPETPVSCMVNNHHMPFLSKVVSMEWWMEAENGGGRSFARNPCLSVGHPAKGRRVGCHVVYVFVNGKGMNKILAIVYMVCDSMCM